MGDASTPMDIDEQPTWKCSNCSVDMRNATNLERHVRSGCAVIPLIPTTQQSRAAPRILAVPLPPAAGHEELPFLDDLDHMDPNLEVARLILHGNMSGHYCNAWLAALHNPLIDWSKVCGYCVSILPFFGLILCAHPKRLACS